MSGLRIGSRGSKLALWQAEHVASLLRRGGHHIEIEIIKTTGDTILGVALAQVGTKGMFTKEIEEALADGRIDLAVHSMKDVPTELAPEFVLAATLEREDPSDAFLSVSFDQIADLAWGAHVGTSSLRRQAQLMAMRPDLKITPLRGNVDTRIRKLESGDYDAILLASAGVKRLGLEAFVKQRLAPEQMLPAVGQGALAIEVTCPNQRVYKIVRLLNHAASEESVACERALLHALGGGCQVPIAAYAERNAAGKLALTALVARPDGSEVVREEQTGDSPVPLGESVAKRLLEEGAQRILADVYQTYAVAPQQP
ncbi:MAG: hydroxymethylbilane synthase [Acidobacteriaceae bacterium]